MVRKLSEGRGQQKERKKRKEKETCRSTAINQDSFKIVKDSLPPAPLFQLLAFGKEVGGSLAGTINGVAQKVIFLLLLLLLGKDKGWLGKTAIFPAVLHCIAGESP